MLTVRRSLVLLAAVAALVAIMLPSTAPAAPSATAAATCPGTFQVLHNDRIGSLRLPAGPYTIAPAGGLSCSQASALFTRFLEDWDGVLPDGWRVRGSGFVQASTGRSFTVKPATTPPVPPPPNGQTCPGTFTLRNNDRIGALLLPKGNYVIQITRKGGALSCDAADVQFSVFLTKNYTAPLPSPWRLNAATGTFSKGTSNVGFRVIRTGGGTGGGGNTTGILCPGTFQVLHDDMINALRVPKGPYYVYVIGRLTCQEVINDFRADLQNNRIPSRNWTLDVQTATFLFNKTRGFRVEPANGV